MGRVKTMTYPDGELVTYGYLPNNAINSVVGPLNTYVSSIEYTNWGAVAQMVLGPEAMPAIELNYTYYSWRGDSYPTPNGEARSRLTRVTAGRPPDLTSLQDLEYVDYDLDGNIGTIRDHKAGGMIPPYQQQNFSYDDLHRLTSAQAFGGQYSEGDYGPEVYQYTGEDGKIGNLTNKAGTAYTYGQQAPTCPDGPLTKPHAVVAAGTNTFCYDRNGNMVTRNSGADTLTYDAENRLVQVTPMLGLPSTFTYGPGGERVKGVVGSPQVTTYYIGNHYEVQGTTVRKYYYAGSTRVAMQDSSQYFSPVFYLLSDHLGSTAITVDM